MFDQLPASWDAFAAWDWAAIQPYFDDLRARSLDETTVAGWLADWTRIAALVEETEARLSVPTTQNTEDKEAEARYEAYLEQVMQPYRSAANALKEKLLASGLTPAGLETPLRQMRAEASIFREANMPLMVEDEKLSMEFARVLGTQTVEWEGETRTLSQMRPLLQDPDRATRERAWRLMSDRQLQDRDTINDIWGRFLALRLKLAANADQPDYLAYRWLELGRLDYTLDDARRFEEAIEAVVVPAAARIYERRRRQLGVETFRPWDESVDPQGRPALHPFDDADELARGTASIFHAVDGQLGDYFDTMRREDLLDLPNRKGKGPGGYCTDFPAAGRPFIFMNAVGTHDDVQTLLHEGGHAFHTFESSSQPYLMQKNAGIPVEFAEVASMSMELLAGPYLARPTGFYDEAGAARARIEHLEGLILFWPYMEVVDAFQRWVYTNPADAADPANCDRVWAALWDRFMQGQDWSGLEDARVTGWHRKHHIFRFPLYYIEYGLAQLGAVQVWRNSLRDEAKAVADYRHGLALGGTASLPELFRAAGAAFKPDRETLRDCVDLIEETIDALEGA